jgi:hypothetical protein
MDKPEGPKHMLGYSVCEAGERPGLPAPPLPGNSLEAGLQMGLTGLASRILLLQLDKLPSNLLNQNKTHTQTHNSMKQTNKSRNNNDTKLIKNKAIYTPHKGLRDCRGDTAPRWSAKTT